MTKQNIITRTLASGTQISLPIFQFKGKNPNKPKVYIQSSVHGSEIQGYLVCLHLIEHFAKNPPLGDTTIVPLANPYATDCKFGEYTVGRFDPSRGYNWNRNYLDLSYLAGSCIKKYKNTKFEKLIPAFKQEMQKELAKKLKNASGYHTKLALQLQTLAMQADIVLDLHCASQSLPYAYSPTYLMQDATKLGCSFIIEIPHAFTGALDEAVFCPWLALTSAYNNQNPKQAIKNSPISSFTIELGNQECIDSNLARLQANNIINYLQEKPTKTTPIYACKLEDFRRIYTSIGGMIIKSPAIGQKVKAGDVLMSISSPSLFGKTNFNSIIKNSTTNIKAELDCIPLVKINSPIVHEGMTVMHLMTKVRKL